MYVSDLPQSERMWPIIGLNLMGLLAHNRIAEFHTELELIPIRDHSNDYVRYCIQLEQYMMEGNYSKLLAGSANLPTQHYDFFARILTDTVRFVLECR